MSEGVSGFMQTTGHPAESLEEGIRPDRRESTKASQETIDDKHELQRLRVVVRNTHLFLDALEEGKHMSTYAANMLREKLQ